MHKSQRLINHVALVLDASSSMRNWSDKLIEVADEQIRHLALRSEELSQETRVSVYTFADRVTCQIFDMDVMRLPSIKDLYKSNGMTALVDAVIRSQNDLSTTSQIYGDHSFLTFVLTDGMENRSTNPVRALPQYLNKQGWTVGFLVPDSQSVAFLERVRVARGNISVWDTQSETGIQDSFSTIKTATDTFMRNRASGTTSTTLFGGTDTVNSSTVKVLTPFTSIEKFRVDADSRIDEFVKGTLGYYNPGSAYYQLTKRETIQPQKSLLVVEKRTGNVYGGTEARRLVGLPDTSVRVRPNTNPDYEIYVQSTSLNRKLLAGTKVLVRV